MLWQCHKHEGSRWGTPVENVENDDFGVDHIDGNDEKEVDTPFNIEHLNRLQQADESLESARTKVTKDHTEAFFWGNHKLKRKWIYHDGTKSNWQVVLPVKLQSTAIKFGQAHHLEGQLGVSKTKERIIILFCWPGMFQVINGYCSTC